MRILVVEDDLAIAAGICEGLALSNFHSEHVTLGAEALALLTHTSFDFIVLDLGLPDIDGQQLCQEIRKKYSTPIIIVSARDTEIDRVLGLELGADDYLVKPFSMKELVARIRAVLRRQNIDVAEVKAHTTHGLFIDERVHRVMLNELEISLTNTEYEILTMLYSDPGKTFKRHDILSEVWGNNWFGSTKTLDAHVASIRKKLGDANWIESVRGVGFRLGNVS
ncbi:unannotated protein [freshwater metagenome]|uniref:Unannotated protein n=1 Tax=freshwater metagenome TaxID=449393 RepID=A0A6J7XVF6_9ZZZZ|nr:response regulator [Actinomycetota bacterium]